MCGEQDNPEDYTIPRTTGELQLTATAAVSWLDYTIPRTTGELQLRANA